jgi:hypothetical protein
LTRKSSKTGEYAAFARLAAFSFTLKNVRFKNSDNSWLHGRAAIGGEKSLIDTNGQDFWEIGTIFYRLMFKKLLKSSLFR